MRRGDGVKVGCLTTGDLMDVWKHKGETRSKACHEKSAEAIVPEDD